MDPFYKKDKHMVFPENNGTEVRKGFESFALFDLLQQGIREAKNREK